MFLFIYFIFLFSFLFKFLVLRILFLVEFNFNFFLNCFSINSIKRFFSIKFSFRTYIYHVYICCINRIYFYIRYRYKYSTKIISLFSHQCNSFSLTFSICLFLLYFVVLHFFVYREFKRHNILAHSLNIFNFSHKKEERPYFFDVPLP